MYKAPDSTGKMQILVQRLPLLHRESWRPSRCRGDGGVDSGLCDRALYQRRDRLEKTPPWPRVSDNNTPRVSLASATGKVI